MQIIHVKPKYSNTQQQIPSLSYASTYNRA